MNDFLSKIMAVKEQEVALLGEEPLLDQQVRPSLYDTVSQRPAKMHVIAEVKRASPSQGDIRAEVDILAQAKAYQAAGVSAISVLTDEQFFKGSLADLRQIAQAIELPILCKDFLIDAKQLRRAKNAGASIVLLIVSALEPANLEHLFHTAEGLGLEVLVEVHDQAELVIAEKLGAKLIGINNRNLSTFEVSLEVSHALGPLFQSPALYFSESGIRQASDVTPLTPYYHGVLVGETLMRAADPAVVAEGLQVRR